MSLRALKKTNLGFNSILMAWEVFAWVLLPFAFFFFSSGPDITRVHIGYFLAVSFYTVLHISLEEH